MAIAVVAHTFYYTAVSCLMSRLAPYIPTAKAGGFTALFGKTSIAKAIGGTIFDEKPIELAIAKNTKAGKLGMLLRLPGEKNQHCLRQGRAVVALFYEHSLDRRTHPY